MIPAGTTLPSSYNYVTPKICYSSFLLSLTLCANPSHPVHACGAPGLRLCCQARTVWTVDHVAFRASSRGLAACAAAPSNANFVIRQKCGYPMAVAASSNAGCSAFVAATWARVSFVCGARAKAAARSCGKAALRLPASFRGTTSLDMLGGGNSVHAARWTFYSSWRGMRTCAFINARPSCSDWPTPWLHVACCALSRAGSSWTLLVGLSCASASPAMSFKHPRCASLGGRAGSSMHTRCAAPGPRDASASTSRRWLAGGYTTLEPRRRLSRAWKRPPLLPLANSRRQLSLWQRRRSTRRSTAPSQHASVTISMRS